MTQGTEKAPETETARALFWPALLRPGFLLMHVVVVLLFLMTLQLGWWQWERSEARGWSAQNMSYAFQWPIYGLMGVWFYSKMMRMELERGPDAEAPGASLVLYRPARIDTTGDPELAAYNAHLAELNEQVLRRRRD